MKPPSMRQLQMLRLAALGYSNPRIGRELWVTDNTVKTTLSNTFVRLNANDRTHAVSIASFHGYLELVPEDDGFDVLIHVDGPARLARQRQVRDVGEYVMSKTENSAVLEQVRARVLAGAS